MDEGELRFNGGDMDENLGVEETLETTEDEDEDLEFVMVEITRQGLLNG